VRLAASRPSGALKPAWSQKLKLRLGIPDSSLLALPPSLLDQLVSKVMCGHCDTPGPALPAFRRTAVRRRV
jgi:hypothetical protein